MRAAVQASVSSKGWAQVSRQYGGSGAEQGIDLTVAVKWLQRMRGAQQHSLAAAAEHALAGGQVTGERAALAVRGTSDTCPRCHICAETLLHRYWQCIGNAWLESPEIEATNYLSYRACHEPEAMCFWTRGLVPGPWTQAPPAVATRWTRQDPASNSAPDNYVLSSDGSGGPNASDPRLRRVGYGAAVFAVTAGTARLPALSAGTLDGVQTVPRGEVVGAREALRQAWRLR